jgi:hypothetical protein
MKARFLLFPIFSISISSLYAQNTPSDFVNQLPKIFTAVCFAKNAEVQAYGEQIAAFSKKIQSKLDALAPLKTKVQSGMKINPNPNPNTSALESQLQKANKMISHTDFSVKFDKALHSDAEKTMQQQMNENIKKQSAASDYKEMEKLIAEIKQIKNAYCQASTSHYLDLLIEQRSILEIDISYIVAAADLTQKINCNIFGYTYFPELSYENAYIRILDHLKYMTLLLTFCPGNE